MIIPLFVSLKKPLRKISSIVLKNSTCMAQQLWNDISPRKAATVAQSMIHIPPSPKSNLLKIAWRLPCFMLTCNFIGMHDANEGTEQGCGTASKKTILIWRKYSYINSAFTRLRASTVMVVSTRTEAKGPSLWRKFLFTSQIKHTNATTLHYQLILVTKWSVSIFRKRHGIWPK